MITNVNFKTISEKELELLDKTIERIFEKNDKSFSLRTTAVLAIQLVRKYFNNFF